MEDQLITREELAKILNVSIAYLSKKPKGLRFVKISHAVLRYRMSDVKDWLNSRSVAA